MRYAREWLEQQAVAGYLACDDPAEPPERRRFRLPEGHAEVLVDPDSPYHAAPLALALAGTAGVLPRLLEAYRHGGGVAYADYGRGIRDGIAAANRPMFLHELAGAWLPAVPDLHQRLGSAPPPRVLDLGCGLGARRWRWPAPTRGPRSSGSTWTRRRSPPPARRRPRPAWPTGSRSRSATPPDLAPEAPFDLVTIFEALHDMGDPVGALSAARERLADGGSVLVADERVADTFTAPGDATERLMYGWSVLHCLPATLAEDPVEANGTVLRAPTLARWAAAAGFAGFEVLAIDNPFWRFYRLRG